MDSNKTAKRKATGMIMTSSKPSTTSHGVSRSSADNASADNAADHSNKKLKISEVKTEAKPQDVKKGVSFLVEKPAVELSSSESKLVDIQIEQYLTRGERVWWREQGKIKEGTYLGKQKSRKISNACMVMRTIKSKNKDVFVT